MTALRMAILFLVCATPPMAVHAQGLSDPASPPTATPADDTAGLALHAPDAQRFAPERPIYRTRAGRDSAEPSSPAAGQAATGYGVTGTADWWGHLRALAALVGVVGLILLLAWGYRITLQGGSGALGFRGRQPGLIQLISRQALAPRHVLCLVRVGPRMVLLGLTPMAIKTLDVIDDPEWVARLAGQAEAARPGSATATFHGLLEREAAAYSAAGSEQRTAGSERAGSDRIAAIVAQLASAQQSLRARSA